MNIRISKEWDSLLERFANQKTDIYFYEGYVKLYENDKNMALAIICEENDNILLMPFLRKEIDSYYDFETPYGYGGPIANTDNCEWIEKAIRGIKTFLRNERYVCGFIRFHTLLNNAEFCKKHFDVFYDRSTVVIDTTKSPEDIWKNQIISKNRNMIRKAEKNGLIYEADYNFDTLDDFIKLYDATMIRLNADKFYFFDKSYYREFVKQFKGNSFLGTVRKDGQLICAALFMYSLKYGHYHLEGSNYAFSGLGSNNLLLWKTALEFNRLGVSEFHLGGGYDSEPENSLLKFKKSFSNNLRNFYVGKMIFNQEKYNELKNNWKLKNPDKINKYGNLLLCYRY